METIVVTKHKVLIVYLYEIGLIDSNYKLIEYPTIEDIRGKKVIGILPLSLASEAFTITEIPLDLPYELIDTELSLEEIRQYARKPVTYKVKQIIVL